MLLEIGAVSDDLRRRLVRMARFRNLLVHLYSRIDNAEIYRLIAEDLGDFDEYLLSVSRYLGSELG